MMTNSKYQNNDKQILITTAPHRTGQNDITDRFENICENIENINGIRNIMLFLDMFKILPLDNFKCSFNYVYRVNSVFIDYYRLFLPNFYRAMHFSAKRGIAIACRPSVCLSVRLSVRLSVTLVDQDHIRWKSWKLIARSSSPTPSLFVAQRISTYSQGNMGKFGGD